MPFSATQLTTYYTALTGTPPDAATAVLFQAYATQNSGGALTDAQTLALVFNSTQVQSTFEVIESTYQFFTGSGVSAGGLAYLRGDTGAGNANGLNTAYYTAFNTENRYYNFAVNLATTGGAGASNFASTYGSISIQPTTTGGVSPFIQAAYESIVGSANVGTASANAAIADIFSRLPFFTQVAQQRAGGVDVGGAAGQNIALKAIIVGYILEEANKADVGTYAKAIDQLEASVAAGNAVFGANILTTYGPGGVGFNTGVGTTTTTGAGGPTVALTVGTDVINATTGNTTYVGLVDTATPANSTLTAADVINAQGANNTLILTVNGNVASASNGAILNNIQTIDLRETVPSTPAIFAQFDASTTSATAFNSYLSSGNVAFYNLGQNATGGVIGNGSAFGFAYFGYVAGVTSASIQLQNGTVGGVQVNGATAALTTVTLTSTGAANSVANLTMNTATTLNISANTNLTVGLINSGTTTAGTLSTINVTNASTQVALGTIFGNDGVTEATSLRTITAGNGGFSARFGANTAGTLSVVTGTGADNIRVDGNLLASTNINTSGSSTATAAQGTDTITINGTIAAGATINGGGNATFATLQNTFQNLTTGAAFTTAQRGQITGFSTVSLIDALVAGSTYDINAIGAQNFRTIGTAGAGGGLGFTAATGFFDAGSAATLNAASGTTVTLTGSAGGAAAAGIQTNQGGLNIALANAVTGTADVLNLAYAAQGTTANANATTSQIATVGVETINVSANRSAASATNSLLNLSITDAVLQTLNVTGNESFAFSTNTTATAGPYTAFVQLTTINAGANTGVATIDVSQNTGYLSGSNQLSVTTGSAADTITVKDFTRITAGAGADTINVLTTTNGQSYSSFVDAAANDKVFLQGAVGNFGTTGNPAVQAKIVLNPTAVFQDYLDAATGALHNGAGEVNSFDFGGNTYLVVNNSAAVTFQNGADSLIQLVGIHTVGSITAGVVTLGS